MLAARRRRRCTSRACRSTSAARTFTRKPTACGLVRTRPQAVGLRLKQSRVSSHHLLQILQADADRLEWVAVDPTVILLDDQKLHAALPRRGDHARDVHLPRTDLCQPALLKIRAVLDV